ncbi:MAG TPA: ABC transporter permease [Terriglobales bacterium]
MLTSRRWRRELQEEMRLHRELRGDDRRFGNELLILERSRGAWGWTWLETWGQDIRQGVRRLGRTPLVTLLALLSLGLGMGATTALFSLADAIVLRPLPVERPQELVQLNRTSRDWPYFSNPLWEALWGQAGTFAGAFAIGSNTWPLAGSESEVNVSLVSGGYFPTLGLAAQRGRLLGPRDDYRGCPAVADISDGFWRAHFGGSEAAVGSVLTVGGHAFTVIGVTPAPFFGMQVGSRFDLTVPLCAEAVLRGADSLLQAKNGGWLQVFGRLRLGETRAQAAAKLAAARPRWLNALPSDEQADFHTRLQSAAQGTSWIRTQEATPLWILLSVAGLVWLVACVNLAALMTARAGARRPEMAVRAALGASRGRLVRHELIESLILTAGGTALGVALADWGCRAALRFWSSPGLSLNLDLRPDGRLLAFTAGTAVVTALLIGLTAALRSGTTTHGERPRAKLGHKLLACQLATTLLLLAGAGLFARSLAQLTGPGKGFDARGVLLVRFPEGPNSRTAGAAAAGEAMLARLRALPGVTAASATFIIPSQGSSWGPEVSHAGLRLRYVAGNAVAPGSFAILRTPIVAGRDFTPEDASRGAAILNQSLARRLFGSGAAVGQTVTSTPFPGTKVMAVPVIGVVADAKYYNLRKAAPPTIYFPLAAQFWMGKRFELRSAIPVSDMEAEIRTSLGTGTRVEMQSLTGIMDGGLRPERLLAWIAGGLGGMALLLAALGLYGVTLYNAGRRKREFAVRSALGARGADISRQIWRESGITLAWGLAMGAGLSWLAVRAGAAALGKLLYETSPADAGIWAASALALAAATALAAWLPARRAGSADPISALREE